MSSATVQSWMRQKGRAGSPLPAAARAECAPCHPGLLWTTRLATIAVLAFLVAVSCYSASAQVQQAWVGDNNGVANGTHQAVKMALDTNGNIYVTGFSQNTNGNVGYATIKYAPNGSQLWAARFDPTNTATAKPADVVLDSNGSAIVTGSAVTVKYDTHGNQVWTTPYAGTSLAVDTNGNVCVTGIANGFTTVKIGPQGSNLWLSSYSDPAGPTIGEVVLVDGRGNVYVSGSDTFVSEGIETGIALTTIKYDPNGSQLWASCYKFLDDQGVQVGGAALDRAGNFYVVANCLGGFPVPYQSLAFSDSDGGLLLSVFNPTGNLASQAHGLALDSWDNVFVTGQNERYPYPNGGYGTYKIDTNGMYVWTNIYEQTPTGGSAGTAIAVDKSDNVYVTGYSPGTNSGNDIVTIEYDNNGNQLWLGRYNGPANGDDEANAIAVDVNGNVYVAGYETVAGGGTEMILIKYAPGPILNKQANGNILLQAEGSPAQIFDFQASTNLQTWQDLGTSTADTNGNAQFLDTNAPLFPYRFYQANPR